jgi:hypothetical protein
VRPAGAVAGRGLRAVGRVDGIARALGIGTPRISVSNSGTMARTPSPNSFQIVCRCSCCIATRFFTNSAASGPTALGSITMLTNTPPTGMPKSLNHWMKRVTTAIGSASGSVTK